MRNIPGMTTAAMPVETETVLLLPVDQCHKSPSQPRRRGENKEPDADFVKSIVEKGVISPIIVRVRKAGGWEIVYGHRRHAGSIIAKRDTIPGIVRDLTDDEVFELQLIENVHRQDMHPLDEADGFKRMVDRGKTAQYIADKVGRPVNYVAQRLKLCDLVKQARAALDAEDINLGVAVMIARIPPALQAEALDSIQDWWTVAQVKKELENRYLLRLDQAPFDISDTKLVAAAGACTSCPKRTGQQRELFPDAARADMCTDRVCYRGKLDALWQIRKKEAAAGGTPVIEGKAAQKAMGYGGGYKKLDSEEWTGSGYKKVRSLFGKNLPPVTLARDEQSGDVVELVKQVDVDKALKRSRPRDTGNDAYREQNRRAKAKEALRAAALEVAIGSAVERIGRLTDAKVIRFLTQSVIETSWHDSESAIVKRRKLAESVGKKRAKEVDLDAYLKTLTKPQDVAGLGLEVVLWSCAPSRYSKGEPVWAEIIKALGIDYPAIERRVAAEAKAAKKTKGKAKPAAK